MFQRLALLLSLGGATPLLAQTPAAPAVPGVAGQPSAPPTPWSPTTRTNPGAPVPVNPSQPAISPAQRPAPNMFIGRPAPALGVNVWIKGQPIDEYQAEQIYVVEFFSRGSAACQRSEPFLSELQSVYKDRNVAVLSVALMETDGPGPTDAFIKQFGDRITHTIGYDNTGDMARRFLQPTGQSGIPVAFAIDGRGRIAWIGHPLDGLDRVVKALTDGTWDLTKARAEAVRRDAADAKSQPIIAELEEAFGAGQTDAALAAMDRLAAIDPPITGEWVLNKFAFLLLQRRDADKAYAYAQSVADGVLKNDAETLKAIAWMILAEPGVVRRDVVLARSFAQRADELTKHADPNVLDTLAKAQFDSGDLAGAVETQRLAVDAAILPSQKKELEQRLRQYAAAKKSAPSAKPG